MNIYKKQMNQLGLNIEEYSKLLGVPEEVIRKNINGKGEVVKNMDINNFLKKNLFIKHQEVEENKEEKKVEALNIKLARGENSYENKKEYLLNKYPDSIEVQWYINEYNKEAYFKKYNVKNKFDLMRRYKFNCNKGRLKGLKEVGESTIDRLICKQYNELGKETAYTLICQLYDCFELGGIKEKSEKMKNYNIEKGKKGFLPIKYTKEEQNLRNWYNKFDLEKFIKENSILYKDIAEAINIPYGSVYPMKRKSYVPNQEILRRLKDYVDSFENKFETKNVTMEQAKVFDISANVEDITKPMFTQEDLLRNLLKDRLTEEEKTLIRIFGGQI